MFWTRLEFANWTVGLEFEGFAYTAHIGPLKVSYVKPGTSFYHDLQALRADKHTNEG